MTDQPKDEAFTAGHAEDCTAKPDDEPMMGFGLAGGGYQRRIVADLLAALVSAADMLDIADSYLSFAPGSMGGIQMKEARDQARAAIRKARGDE